MGRSPDHDSKALSCDMVDKWTKGAVVALRMALAGALATGGGHAVRAGARRRTLAANRSEGPA